MGTPRNSISPTPQNRFGTSLRDNNNRVIPGETNLRNGNAAAKQRDDDMGMGQTESSSMASLHQSYGMDSSGKIVPAFVPPATGSPVGLTQSTNTTAPLRTARNPGMPDAPTTGPASMQFTPPARVTTSPTQSSPSDEFSSAAPVHHNLTFNSRVVPESAADMEAKINAPLPVQTAADGNRSLTLPGGRVATARFVPPAANTPNLPEDMKSQLAKTYPALGQAGSPQNKEFVAGVKGGTITPDNAWNFAAEHSFVPPPASLASTPAPTVNDIVAGVQAQSKQRQEFADKKASGELPPNATDTGAALASIKTQNDQLNQNLDRFAAKNGITFTPPPSKPTVDLDLSPEHQQQVSQTVADWTNSRNGFGSGTPTPRFDPTASDPGKSYTDSLVGAGGTNGGGTARGFNIAATGSTQPKPDDKDDKQNVAAANQ